MPPLGQKRALSPDPGNTISETRNFEDSTNPESLALLPTDILHTDSGGDSDMIRGSPTENGAEAEDEQGSAGATLTNFIVTDSTFNDIQGDYYSFSISKDYEQAWGKIDACIIPVVFLFSLTLSWEDQWSFIRKDKYYNMALALGSFSYISAALFSNLFLKRVAPKLMLSTMLSFWGIVVTLQGLFTNGHMLHICHFFLGLVEGGLFPSLILYLSCFYPRSKLQMRINIWFIFISISNAFSDMLGKVAFVSQDLLVLFFWLLSSNLHGIVTFLLGLTSYFTLPSSPSHVNSLSEGEEAYVVIKLKEDWNSGDVGHSFRWQGVRRALLPPQVWIAAAVLFLDGIILQSLDYLLLPISLENLGIGGIGQPFNPHLGFGGIGQPFNLGTKVTGLPIFKLMVVVIFFQILGYISDQYRRRGMVCIISSLLSTIGLAILVGFNASFAQNIGMLFLTTGARFTAATMFTWITSNATPCARRAAAIAIGSFASKCGGAISILWLFGTSAYQEGDKTVKVTLLVISVLMTIFSFLNLLYLWGQNKRKRTIRSTIPRDQEQPGLGDESSWFEYDL